MLTRLYIIHRVTCIFTMIDMKRLNYLKVSVFKNPHF